MGNKAKQMPQGSFWTN